MNSKHFLFFILIPSHIYTMELSNKELKGALENRHAADKAFIAQLQQEKESLMKQIQQFDSDSESSDSSDDESTEELEKQNAELSKRLEHEKKESQKLTEEILKFMPILQQMEDEIIREVMFAQAAHDIKSEMIKNINQKP